VSLRKLTARLLESASVRMLHESGYTTCLHESLCQQEQGQARLRSAECSQASSVKKEIRCPCTIAHPPLAEGFLRDDTRWICFSFSSIGLLTDPESIYFDYDIS